MIDVICKTLGAVFNTRWHSYVVSVKEGGQHADIIPPSRPGPLDMQRIECHLCSSRESPVNDVIPANTNLVSRQHSKVLSGHRTTWMKTGIVSESHSCANTVTTYYVNS